MPRFSSRSIVILFALACISRCVGQSSRTQDAPKNEAGCSPEKLAERFIEVSARLDKPGDLPSYQLGEPVIVELDIRNLSERNLFTIPTGGRVAYYMVEATQYEKPVPQTSYGRMIAEGIKKFGKPRMSGVVGLGQSVHNGLEGHEVPADPWSFKLEHQKQPTQIKTMANLLCDMTNPGEYELRVRFPVRVFSLADEGKGPHVTGKGLDTMRVVRLANPLKLDVNSHLYHLEPPPTIIPSEP